MTVNQEASQVQKLLEEIEAPVSVDPESVVNVDVGPTAEPDVNNVKAMVYEPYQRGHGQTLDIEKRYSIDGEQYIIEIRKRPICPSCDTLMAGEEMPLHLKGSCYICGINTCPVCLTKCSACERIMCNHHSTGYGIDGNAYCVACLDDILREEEFQRRLQIYGKKLEKWELEAEHHRKMERIEREDERKRMQEKRKAMEKVIDAELKRREMKNEHEEELRELEIENRKLDLQQQEQKQDFEIEQRQQEIKEKEVRQQHQLELLDKGLEEQHRQREHDLEQEKWSMEKAERDWDLEKDQRLHRFEETEKMLDLIDTIQELKEGDQVNVEEDEIVIEAEE